MRFPGFEGEWVEKKFGEVVTNKSGKYNPTSARSPIKCIELEHLVSENGQLIGYIDGSQSGSIKNIFSKGDVLFGKLRPYLRKYLQAPFDGVCSSEIWVLKGKGVSNEFLYQIVQTDKFIDLANQSSGSKMPRADWSVVEKGTFSFPTITEQEKISGFLSLLDSRIETQNKIIEKLETLIKYMRENLFCDIKSQIPLARFHGFKDKWTKVKLVDIVSRVTRRNKENLTTLPLTIAAKHGLVDQTTFFNKQIASKDMSNYYLLLNGDFAYNKSYSNDYPWGAVKRLNLYDKGALSSLYICFRPNVDVNSDYLAHYFETTKWHKGISDISGEGARNHGLLNMSVDDYFNTRHYIPSDQEQNRIAFFLNSLSDRLTIENDILQGYKKQKNYLLQTLFI